MCTTIQSLIVQARTTFFWPLLLICTDYYSPNAFTQVAHPTIFLAAGAVFPPLLLLASALDLASPHDSSQVTASHWGELMQQLQDFR